MVPELSTVPVAITCSPTELPAIVPELVSVPSVVPSSILTPE